MRNSRNNINDTDTVCQLSRGEGEVFPYSLVVTAGV